MGGVEIFRGQNGQIGMKINETSTSTGLSRIASKCIMKLLAVKRKTSTLWYILSLLHGPCLFKRSQWGSLTT